MDVSKIGEPHQNLGNHLEISTTQPRVNRLETYLLEVPWSLHLDNKMHEIDHGKRMQVRKAPRTRRGGGDANSSPLEQHYEVFSSKTIGGLFYQEGVEIHPSKSGFGGQRACYAHPAVIHHLGCKSYWSSNWTHFATRFFMLHPPALTISWTSARVYGCALQSADQLQLMQHFAESFNFGLRSKYYTVPHICIIQTYKI